MSSGFSETSTTKTSIPYRRLGRVCVCVCVCGGGGGGEGGVLGNRVKREALLLVLRLRTGNHLFLSADD